MDSTDQLNMHAFRIQLVEGDTYKYDHTFEARCKILALVRNVILGKISKLLENVTLYNLERAQSVCDLARRGVYR